MSRGTGNGERGIGRLSEAEKTSEGILPWSLPKRPATGYLDFSPVRLILISWPSALVENKSMLFEAPKCMVIYYCSYGKLIQLPFLQEGYLSCLWSLSAGKSVQCLATVL